MALDGPAPSDGVHTSLPLTRSRREDILKVDDHAEAAGTERLLGSMG